jgi:hypothetical protein
MPSSGEAPDFKSNNGLPVIQTCPPVFGFWVTTATTETSACRNPPVERRENDKDEIEKSDGPRNSPRRKETQVQTKVPATERRHGKAATVLTRV